MQKEECLTLFQDVQRIAKRMDDKKFGMLMRSVVEYRFEGVEYQGDDPIIGIAFDTMKDQIDRIEGLKKQRSNQAKARQERKRPAEQAVRSVQDGTEEVQSGTKEVQSGTEEVQSGTEEVQRGTEQANGGAPIHSNPIQSIPNQSDPIQSAPEYIPGGGPVFPRRERKAFGKYGWVKLTDPEYQVLSEELGEEELKRCIDYVDQSAQATGNKNRWKDFTVVLRKCSRQKWYRNDFPRREEIPKGNSGRLGDAELGFIRRALDDEYSTPGN